MRYCQNAALWVRRLKSGGYRKSLHPRISGAAFFKVKGVLFFSREKKNQKKSFMLGVAKFDLLPDGLLDALVSRSSGSVEKTVANSEKM